MKRIVLTIAVMTTVFGAAFYIYYKDSQSKYEGYKKEIAVLSRDLDEADKALNAFRSIDKIVFKQACESVALDNYSTYIKENSVKRETEDTISYFPKSPEVIEQADKMRTDTIKKCDDTL